MAIHIGLVPPLSENSNDVFTIFSSKSNLIRLQSSPSNNVFIDYGDYKLGQRSNEPFVFSHKGSNIISYDENSIRLNRQIVATSNLNIVGLLNTPSISCSNLFSSNIVIKNNSNEYKFLECSSNNIETFYLTNTTGYISGQFGIGVVPTDKKYSLMTSSNVFVNGDVSAKTFIAEKIVSSNNNLSRIVFNENSIIIDSATVTVCNLQLGGCNSFDTLKCGVLADLSGLLLASNVSIFNRSLEQNPFKINQRLITNRYGDNITGNPISVKSQHLGIPDPTILELSSCGNLILGDVPSLVSVNTITIISDYMLRGLIPTNRRQHFKGYLHFSSNNSEKTLFAVNKSGQLSIGSSNHSALLEIKNGFTGTEENYVKPSSIVFLENSNEINELAFLKCANSNLIKFQITSNATICFNELPIDMYKYNIESHHSYLKNIDTSKISSCDPLNKIDMSYATLSNINNVYTCNLYTSNINTSNIYSEKLDVLSGYIGKLTVGSFSTSSFAEQGDQSIFAIDSDHMVLSGSNLIISNDGTTTLRNPPSFVNVSTDKMIIKTKQSTLNANGYTIYGNNKSITLFCKNESVALKSCVAHELWNNTGGFAMVSSMTTNTESELYITPIIQSGEDKYGNPALTITYENVIRFGNKSFINSDGSLFIKSRNSIIDGFTQKSVNIGDGLLVFSSIATDMIDTKYACLNTNNRGSLDIGRGISEATGPFFKQGGWENVSELGRVMISHTDYGVKDNTSGSIHIQVQGPNKIGNTSVSFLRFGGTAEIFNIVNHKSTDLAFLTVTAVPSGIQIQTDIGCKVCWTSIGSC